jgi:hypothetical protein
VTISKRSVRSLVATSLLLAAAVLLVGRVSAHSVPEGSLPTVGYPVHDSVLSYVPTGGTLLLVSESCATCRDRAGAFISRLRRRQDHVLVVATGGGRRFQDLAQNSPDVADRIRFLSSVEFMNQLDVRAVPTYVIVDQSGRVVEAGASTVGWLTGMANPAIWWRSWARILGR